MVGIPVAIGEIIRRTHQLIFNAHLYIAEFAPISSGLTRVSPRLCRLDFEGASAVVVAVNLGSVKRV